MGLSVTTNGTARESHRPRGGPMTVLSPPEVQFLPDHGDQVDGSHLHVRRVHPREDDPSREHHGRPVQTTAALEDGRDYFSVAAVVHGRELRSAVRVRMHEDDGQLPGLGEVDGLLDVFRRPSERDLLAPTALVVGHGNQITDEEAQAPARRPSTHEDCGGLFAITWEDVASQLLVHLLRHGEGARGRHSPNSRARECSTKAKCVPTLSLFGSHLCASTR